MFQVNNKDCWIGFFLKKQHAVHKTHISNTKKWKGGYTMQMLKKDDSATQKPDKQTLIQKA